jgi:hypothetical protein
VKRISAMLIYYVLGFLLNLSTLVNMSLAMQLFAPRSPLPRQNKDFDYGLLSEYVRVPAGRGSLRH